MSASWHWWRTADEILTGPKLDEEKYTANVSNTEMTIDNTRIPIYTSSGFPTKQALLLLISIPFAIVFGG